MLVKYVCRVRARDLGMKPKIIDVQPMRSISYCRVGFGHCGMFFPSHVMYRSESTKIVKISGSVFCGSSHF